MNQRDLLILIVLAALLTPLAWDRAPKEAITEKKKLELALNGLYPGMTLGQAEALRGQPDFHWPERMAQQWERPFTRVEYNEDGILLKVEGGGHLTYGDRVVLPWGAPEERIEEVFGPVMSRPEPAKWVYPGMQLWCGSEDPDGRKLSHITLEGTERPEPRVATH